MTLGTRRGRPASQEGDAGRGRAAGGRLDGPGRHVAARPAWRCRACAAPWPCQPAKLGLRREYAHDRPMLAIYLCLLMHDAITDALRVGSGTVDPAAYFTRFLAWTRHGWPPPGPPPGPPSRPPPGLSPSPPPGPPSGSSPAPADAG
ncbi:hypothetical protein [Micromonospora rifamycinica]|uniref:Flavin reductase n=2 Tax=Micromonospora rifamycinica TaxID=291594 RepID=A0A1C5I8L1_9ACTN|nr:hypothetical protein [Micromonospora rifamycinica]SCG54479.1 hypothetical protein GA0070623_2247 [Micromonospora rifamycinica]